MENKEIYIDGVDVSGCVRLQDDNISCDLGGKCQGWDNCYYKQLKRKEQICEELKFRSDYLQMIYNERNQECQELERRLKNTGEEKDIHIRERDFLYEEVKKAEQKLEKIKQIVSGDYVTLDPRAKQEIGKIIEE